MFVLSCSAPFLLLVPVSGDMRLMDKLAVFSTDKSILAEGVCFIFTALLLITGSYIAKT